MAITVEDSVTGSAAELAEQLVTEVMVRDLNRSVALYTALGFTLERRDGSFAALRWGDHRLFLDEHAGLPPPSGPTRANLRILVADVDRLWDLVRTLGLPIERSVADRYYGLRDFTAIDPDGFGLRFASWLPSGTNAPAG